MMNEIEIISKRFYFESRFDECCNMNGYIIGDLEQNQFYFLRFINSTIS